jgi:hypothetical protein
VITSSGSTIAPLEKPEARDANRTNYVSMMREKCRIRQSEITRTLKATLAAGVEVDRVEIEKDGRVVVIICKQRVVEIVADGEQNPWDQVLNNAAD